MAGVNLTHDSNGEGGLAQSGIPGLDFILGGGLPRQRLYLVQGDPGVGKTTLAIQFLMAGVRNGERALYISLSESLEELQAVTESHGWSLEGIDVFELGAGEQAFSARTANTLFHPSEAQLSEVMKRLRVVLEQVRPQRVAFDSLAEVRLMAADPLRYRREILTLKFELSQRGATVLLLDDRTAGGDDLQLQSLAHGVITLRREALPFGPSRRRMEVIKLRGVPFRDGLHDFRITTGGVVVYPRMVAADHRLPYESVVMSSGNVELDALLGGGIDHGSTVLLMGPAGAGKSTVALSFLAAAAQRGEKGDIYTFDESVGSVIKRGSGVGIPIAELVDQGIVEVKKVDPAEFTPGQFANLLLQRVQKGVSLILIDGLNGYLHAMPRDEHLVLHLHELLSILNGRGTTVLLTVAQHGVVGMAMSQPVDVSYLADTVMLLRYYEFEGEMRQAISVFKRRGGFHERTIRELRLGPPRGVNVGPPLHAFRGVLTGVPTYYGDGKRN